MGEDDNDLEWLKQFENFDLTDSQKQALIFVREVGAIDNSTYRQMADCDTLKASADLRELKGHELLIPKGKGKATYYVAGILISIQPAEDSTRPTDVSTQPTGVSTQPIDLSTQPIEAEIPLNILEEIASLRKREHDFKKGFCVGLCG